MELVKVDVQSEFGIEENIALSLSNAFKPMLDKMEAMEDEFNEVMSMEFSVEKMARCKNLRQRYVKVRTGTDKIHRAEKEKYLTVGRAIDAFKNTQKAASMGKEEQLAEVEKHYENIEKQRIANLQEGRRLELERYESDFIPDNLGTMEEEVWKNYISGIKGNYDRRIEAEKKAETDRIEEEKAEKKRQAEVEKENKRLKADAVKQKKIDDEREKKEKSERKAREKKENDERIAREKKEKIEQDKREKAEAERKEAERIKQDEHDREMADIKAKADKEKKDKEKAEAELEEKKRIEEEKIKVEQARKEEEKEAELNKGDDDKVNELVEQLKSVCNGYTFQSGKNRKMFNNVTDKLNNLIAYIEETNNIK